MPKFIEVPNQGMVEFPDEMSDPEIVAAIKKNSLSYPVRGNAVADGAKALAGGLGKGVGNVALGAQGLVGKGLGSIGLERAGKWLEDDARTGRERLKAEFAPVKSASPMMGATGEFAGEVAATFPVGGFLAKGVSRAAPLLSRAGVSAPTIAGVSSSLATGGMRIGPTGLNALQNTLLRAGGGAATGGTSAALIDQDNFGIGAGLGAALPGVAKLGGKVGGMAADSVKRGANSLMQSAIKPTIAQLKSGDAKLAIEMMLKYGVNPTQGGVSKLRGLVNGLNDDIADRVSSSTATVNKQRVLGALDDVRAKFGNQVSPTADLRAINSTGDDFLNHPNLLGDDIPVQAAQSMKQGTYKVLSKKYGQIGTADTEAQKALARGLKNEIADAVPGIGALNAEESKLISTLGVVERRALMELNKNPLGLASLAQSPASWAMFMADKSALFKSLAARSLNSTATGMQNTAPRLEQALGNPLIRAPIPLIGPRRE